MQSLNQLYTKKYREVFHFSFYNWIVTNYLPLEFIGLRNLGIKSRGNLIEYSVWYYCVLQVHRMSSRCVNPVCVPGVHMLAWTPAVWALLHALHKAACSTWTSLTHLCQTHSLSGSHSFQQKRVTRQPSTTSCFWHWAATMCLWVHKASFVTCHWQWSWMWMRKSTAFSSLLWIGTSRLMPQWWPPSQDIYSVRHANPCIIDWCGARLSAMHLMGWCSWSPWGDF